MHYLAFGKRENPAVLFLHGWGGSTNSFLGVAKIFAGFGFYAVVVDFPGHGKSEEPIEPISVYDYASLTKELVEKLNLKKLTIVGHSFGGRVAVILASLGVCEKLVLVDSAGIKPRRGIVYKLKVLKFKRAKRRVMAGKIGKEALEKYGSEDYKKLSLVMKETFKNIVNEDLSYLLEKISCPALIVWGKRDKDTPMYMAKAFRSGIEKSVLLVYNAGHYSYLEKVDRFVSDLYDFLLS